MVRTQWLARRGSGPRRRGPGAARPPDCSKTFSATPHTHATSPASRSDPATGSSAIGSSSASGARASLFGRGCPPSSSRADRVRRKTPPTALRASDGSPHCGGLFRGPRWLVSSHDGRRRNPAQCSRLGPGLAVCQPADAQHAGSAGRDPALLRDGVRAVASARQDRGAGLRRPASRRLHRTPGPLPRDLAVARSAGGVGRSAGCDELARTGDRTAGRLAAHRLHADQRLDRHSHHVESDRRALLGTHCGAGRVDDCCAERPAPARAGPRVPGRARLHARADEHLRTVAPEGRRTGRRVAVECLQPVDDLSASHRAASQPDTLGSGADPARFRSEFPTTRTWTWPRRSSSNRRAKSNGYSTSPRPSATWWASATARWISRCATG